MLFGGGHFLRGFVAWMLDRLNAETGFGGSAVVVKASPHRGSSPVYDQLNEQDGLFHLTLTSAQEGKAVSSTQLVTSIHRAIDPYQSYPDFVALAAQPEIRFIVSNTTEVGIAYDARDKSGRPPAPRLPGEADGLPAPAVSALRRRGRPGVHRAAVRADRAQQPLPEALRAAVRGAVAPGRGVRGLARAQQHLLRYPGRPHRARLSRRARQRHSRPDRLRRPAHSRRGAVSQLGHRSAAPGAGRTAHRPGRAAR